MSTQDATETDFAGAQCPECGSPCVRATLLHFGKTWHPTECRECDWARD